MLGHDLLQAGRVEILAVRDLVPLVRSRDGGEHLGVDPRVVVTAKPRYSTCRRTVWSKLKVTASNLAEEWRRTRRDINHWTSPNTACRDVSSYVSAQCYRA